MTDKNEETGYYLVDNSPIGEYGPGDVIKLRQSVAEDFSDNLTELDADSDEAAQEAAQEEINDRGGEVHRGQNAGEDFDAEAGQFRVKNMPIGEAEQGDVVELDPDVAYSFRDNLTPVSDDEDVDEENVVDPSPDTETSPSDEDSEGDTDADLRVEGEGEGEAVVEGEEDSEVVVEGTEDGDSGAEKVGNVDAQDSATFDADDEDVGSGEDDHRVGGGDADYEEQESGNPAQEGDFPGDYDSAEAFVDRTPQSDVTEDLESGDYDDHLDAIEQAEQENKDRSGVKNAISERRD